MKRSLPLFLCLCLAGCSDGCSPRPSADQVIQNKQEVLQAEAVREVGVPNVTRFTEMRRLKYLYELRDRADLTCWVYARDLQGKLHLVGVGMGFPIPYGTQYSSPQKVTRHVLPGGVTDYRTMPQAEPNGVFPPTTAEATWTILMTARGPKPYYAETRLEGSPQRLRGADESQAVWPDGKPIPADVDEPPAAKEADVKALESGRKKEKHDE